MSQLSLEKPTTEQEAPRSPDEPRPYKILRPKSGWQALNLPELWQFRDLLLMLALRDIRLRYKQTVLGAAWVVLQPLVAAGIFSFVFGKIAKLPTDGVPPFVFSYAGLLGWNLFASTLTKVSASLVGNANLVSKVYFPRLVLPLSTIFASLLDFAVALAMLVVIMLIAHVAPGLGLVLLPVWMALSKSLVPLRLMLGARVAPVARFVFKMVEFVTLIPLLPVTFPETPLPICNVPRITEVAPV